MGPMSAQGREYIGVWRMRDMGNTNLKDSGYGLWRISGGYSRTHW